MPQLVQNSILTRDSAAVDGEAEFIGVDGPPAPIGFTGWLA